MIGSGPHYFQCQPAALLDKELKTYLMFELINLSACLSNFTKKAAVGMTRFCAVDL
jgi:hypothetical protein